MKRIGIICKTGKTDVAGILKLLLPWLGDKGYEVFIDEETAALIGAEGHSRAHIPSLVDMVVVFGGDGTMLGVTRLVGDRGVPILGVNLGGLGFITEVNRDELFDDIEKILSGSCNIEERIMLTARVN